VWVRDQKGSEESKHYAARLGENSGHRKRGTKDSDPAKDKSGVPQVRK